MTNGINNTGRAAFTGVAAGAGSAAAAAPTGSFGGYGVRLTAGTAAPARGATALPTRDSQSGVPLNARRAVQTS